MTEETQIFLEQYQGGKVLVADWVYAEFQRVSWATLHKWHQKEIAMGLKGLLHQSFRRERAMDDPEVQSRAIALILGRAHLNPKAIWLELVRQYGERVPSIQSFNRWYTEYCNEHKSTVALAVSPKDWRSHDMKAFGSYEPDHYNERWEIDSTIADILWELADDGGGFRRYSLVVAIEVWSRQAKILVVEHSNSIAIASLTRLCLLDWGVPESIKTDNGKDYTSKHYTQLLRNLEILQMLCTPFEPQQKPFVERFNRTFNHGAQFLMHPRYLGHDVITRQKIRARQVWKEFPRKKQDHEIQIARIKRSLREFQAFVEAAVEEYNNTPHSSLPKTADGTHMSPRQRAAEAVNVKRIADVRALDVLLMPAPRSGGKRAIKGKKGVQIGVLPSGRPAWYISPELVTLGEKYEFGWVKLDPQPGVAHLFDSEDCREYLCRLECPEITATNIHAVIAQTRELEKEQRATVSAARRELRQIGPAAEQEVAEVVQLFPGQEHQTPALLAAAQVDKPKPVRQYSEKELAQHEQIKQRLLAKEAEREAKAAEVHPRDLLLKVALAWVAGNPIPVTEKEALAMQRLVRYGGGQLMPLAYCGSKERAKEFMAWLSLIAPLPEEEAV